MLLHANIQNIIAGTYYFLNKKKKSIMLHNNYFIFCAYTSI